MVAKHEHTTIAILMKTRNFAFSYYCHHLSPTIVLKQKRKIVYQKIYILVDRKSVLF